MDLDDGEAKGEIAGAFQEGHGHQPWVSPTGFKAEGTVCPPFSALGGQSVAVGDRGR